jgi:hypothetical protein
MSTVSDERFQSLFRLGNCIRLRDTDGVEAVRLRLLGDTALYFSRISQKSKSP